MAKSSVAHFSQIVTEATGYNLPVAAQNLRAPRLITMHRIMGLPGLRAVIPICRRFTARKIHGGISGIHDRRVKILDTEMAYWEAGDEAGKPVVFLHGNPTSKYLWRNIIPGVSAVARCLAPDLIGMGDSGPSSSGNYRFVDHVTHLDAWFETMGLKKNGHVTLVVHDWGSALGFHWAHRHHDAIRAIVHMESVVATIKSWEQFPDAARQIFQAIRSPAGEEIILEKNVFVEKILPASIMRKLSDTEMDNYRRPFAEEGEKRRPTLTWPREIPVESDGPQDVVDIVNSYRTWLGETLFPKLYIHADPGFFSPGIKHVTRKWKNQQVVEVPGIHFVQEDSPGLITEAIVSFLKTLK